MQPINLFGDGANDIDFTSSSRVRIPIPENIKYAWLSFIPACFIPFGMFVSIFTTFFSTNYQQTSTSYDIFVLGHSSIRNQSIEFTNLMNDTYNSRLKTISHGLSFFKILQRISSAINGVDIKFYFCNASAQDRECYLHPCVTALFGRCRVLSYFAYHSLITGEVFNPKVIITSGAIAKNVLPNKSAFNILFPTHVATGNIIAIPHLSESDNFLYAWIMVATLIFYFSNMDGDGAQLNPFMIYEYFFHICIQFRAFQHIRFFDVCLQVNSMIYIQSIINSGNLPPYLDLRNMKKIPVFFQPDIMEKIEQAEIRGEQFENPFIDYLLRFTTFQPPRVFRFVRPPLDHVAYPISLNVPRPVSATGVATTEFIINEVHNFEFQCITADMTVERADAMEEEGPSSDKVGEGDDDDEVDEVEEMDENANGNIRHDLSSAIGATE